jgi:2,5-diamino-6-(ribosylamino)-4(3H)-pyrimidinone 5'-phosphate reductase
VVGSILTAAMPLPLLKLDDADIQAVLSALLSVGVTKLMVEGGATIIESFLQQANEFVDQLVITVAPLFIGPLGVEVKALDILDKGKGSLQWKATEVLGKDTVVIFTRGNPKRE